ncbi:GyrI-like domain-containing protein [Enterococcus termitis]
MTVYHSPDFDPENTDMEIAVPVIEQTKDTQIKPSCLCAFSTYVGPYTGLDSAYSNLIKWIEEQGYKMVGVPFEIYQTDPNSTPPEKNVVDVYFPVEV